MRAAHETTNALSGNRHFSLYQVIIRSTKIINKSRQKLGTFKKNKFIFNNSFRKI